MKEKYLNKTGETAFRLWVFSIAIEELKKNCCYEKKANLMSKVTTFASSNWVKFNASEEEKRDLEIILKELEAL